MKFTLFILLLISLAASSAAQPSVEKWVRLFGSRQDRSSFESNYLLAQTKNGESAVTLAAAGLQVLRQVDQHWFIVKRSTTLPSIIHYSIPANANWKLSPALLARYPSGPGDINRIQRFFLSGSDLNLLTRKIKSLNNKELKIEYTSAAGLVVSTTWENLVSSI